MKRPDLNEDQRRFELKEAEKDLADIKRLWPLVEHFARTMGRGVRARGDGPGAVGGHSDPTGSLALAVEADPAEQAADLLTQRVEAFASLRVVANGFRRLEPLSESQVERGRVNTVELCAECNEPAPVVKRFNGAPYHPEVCFWQAYNRVRGRRD